MAAKLESSKLLILRPALFDRGSSTPCAEEPGIWPLDLLLNVESSSTTWGMGIIDQYVVLTLKGLLC